MKQKDISGKIDLNGQHPEVHEYAAYLTLAKNNKRLKLLAPSNQYKIHSPDFKMDGLIWELKCPLGKGKYAIRDTLRQATRQSSNIVIDLQRIKLHEEKALGQINKYFLLEKRLQRIIVITKNKKLVDIQK